MGDRNNPRNSHMLLALERRRRVLEMRIAKIPTGKIAAELGITPRAVRLIIQKAIESNNEQINKDSATLRAEAVGRLSQLRDAYWHSAVNEHDTKAFERVMKIEERWCKLLGLDIAVKPPAADKPFDDLPDATRGGTVAVQIVINADDAKL